jgi:hypothetical protein
MDWKQSTGIYQNILVKETNGSKQVRPLPLAEELAGQQPITFILKQES